MSIQAPTPALQSAALSTMATVLTAASPLLKRISQVDGEYKYNVSMVYFGAEVLKLIVATFFFCCGTTGDFWSSVKSGSTQMRFSLTAFLFFVQNNMGFVVLLYFSASSFQLLMNLRIVAVAIFSMLLLNKSPTQLQWCFIILLCTGGTQHFLSIQGDEPLSESSILGLGAMLLTVATSALANVYNQLALQSDTQQPLMLQNMFLYSYGVIFNALK
jgi:drug/metabolite transporter (DMT)-like permease